MHNYFPLCYNNGQSKHPKSGQVNYSSNNTMLVFILIKKKKTATNDSKAVGHGVGVVLLVVGWSQSQRRESGNCLEEVVLCVE